MTRKDYIIIARAVYNAGMDNNSRTNVALELSRELKGDNDNFDRDRFIEACTGVPT